MDIKWKAPTEISKRLYITINLYNLHETQAEAEPHIPYIDKVKYSTYYRYIIKYAHNLLHPY